MLDAHSGSLFEILVTRGQIKGASGDRAPVTQQQHRYTVHVHQTLAFRWPGNTKSPVLLKMWL